jgi:hypothetical protein
MWRPRSPDSGHRVRKTLDLDADMNATVPHRFAIDNQHRSGTISK